MTRSHTQRIARKIQQKIRRSDYLSTLPLADASTPTSTTEPGSETEAQLRIALEKMELANKVQSGFISVVSHEFRSTLAGIQGFSELLRDRDMESDKTREFATIIYNDARRLDAVISDLLDLEHMMTGQTIPSLTAVDLSALLTMAAEKAREMTQNHTIHLCFEPVLPLLAADQELLSQLCAHLFSNAINYAPDGGEIQVDAQIAADMVHIIFHDQGIGIPAEALEEIFMPFRRVKSPQTRSIKGAGLGLSLVQQIVFLHHGKIWIKSTPDVGSTVHISLPWIDPTPLEEEKKAASHEARA